LAPEQTPAPVPATANSPTLFDQLGITSEKKVKVVIDPAN